MTVSAESNASTFGTRLAAEFAAKRHLCVGIDPHGLLLKGWGLENDAAGAERMGREVIAAAAGVAACVKPQVAFFERFGAAGFTALERVLADAREAGVLVIADAKRGDIGSTFAAYVDSWLSPGSPLEADALTVSPYLGFGSFDRALDHVRKHGKGLFVLAATSNPEARALQTARTAEGTTVARSIVEEAQSFNAYLRRLEQAGAAPEGVARSLGPVGVVLGATLDLEEFGIDVAAPPKPAMPVLAPGFGAQGARIEEATSIFGALGGSLLASESRSLLTGGAAGLAERIRARADALAEAL